MTNFTQFRAAAAGLALLGAGLMPGPALADIVHLDDVIVDGSLCAGADCANGELFGTDVIRLKANNVRLLFDDTSINPGLPANDWRIIINDQPMDGADYFAIEDTTGGDIQVFRVDAGAPLNALYVESSGDVGFGTATPAADLDIQDGTTPAIRLTQDGSAGAPFPAQVWNMESNHLAFSIRDVTSGNTFPFVIRTGAPTSAIDIAASGNVGLGTDAPDAALHVKVNDAGFPDLFRLENTGSDFAGFRFTTTGGSIDFNKAAGNTFRLNVVDGDTWELQLDPAGDLTIKGSIFTAGSCSGGCDRVFSPDFTLPTIEEHAEAMWRDSHLPMVGPTPEGEPFNLTDKTERMLNELEQAHIYIAQLNEEKEILQAKVATHESRLARLEGLLSR